MKSRTQPRLDCAANNSQPLFPTLEATNKNRIDWDEIINTPPNRTLVTAETQKKFTARPTLVFTSITIIGIFWNVDARKKSDEGKKLIEETYQETKGNIPSFKKTAKVNSSTLTKKYESKSKKEDRD